MENETRAVSAAHPAKALCGAAIAGVSALAMATIASELWPAAVDGHGQDGLIAWMLISAGVIGAALCLYLAVIWSLTALVLLIGPAGRTGTALLAALRILAPQLARRVLVGTVLATSVTGLALVPATAATTDSSAGTGQGIAAVAVASELTPAQPVGSDAAPEAAAPTASTEDTDADEGMVDPDATYGEDGDPSLPGLGWGEHAADASPTQEDSPASGPTDLPDGTDAAVTAPSDQDVSAEQEGSQDDADADAQHTSRMPRTPSTVEVRPGDTLWSLTDDLLGPAPEDPSEIAAAWPLLHDANRDVIGLDPDHLEPGQELTVPAPLTPQESS